MGTNRRDFIRGAALLAAGAGIGVPLITSAPKRVNSEVKLMFFSKDPIAIKAVIHSREETNTFAVDMELLKARMPLSAVREVLRGWRTSFYLVLEAPEESKYLWVRAYRDGDRFCVEEIKQNTSPCWLSVSDVRKAVC